MAVHSDAALRTGPRGVTPDPRHLAARGPILPVQIEVPQALARSLASMGQPIPSPAERVALVDTGASFTGVSERVMQRLGVQPIDRIANIGTAGGIAERSIYPARVTFPGAGFPAIEFGEMVSVDLGSEPIPDVGLPLVLLLGRDLLSRFVLVYNGPGANWSLSG